MKARLLAACTAAVTLLSGCTFSTSIDGLLSPPKLSVEQEQIYEALRRAAGSNISLKYPKTGDYLSAFIVSDIDGDGEDEALVFYEKTLLQSEENALRLNVLDQINGSWRSVYDLAAGGAEVEKVMISRLGSNSRTNIIVGYSMVNRGERVLSVYDYRDGALTETLNSSYSLADVCDLDQNGENELLIALGDGWYRSTSGVDGDRDLFGKELAVLFQLEVDGKAVCVSDDAMEATQCGPIRQNDLQQGEVYDARLEGKLTGWHGVRTAPNTLPLIGMNTVPIREQEAFAGKLLHTPSGEKELLVLTDHSVNKIAQKVGFGDASNFSTRFAKATGQSPLQYRKSALKPLETAR